jgi:hypothetical protein
LYEVRLFAAGWLHIEAAHHYEAVSFTQRQQPIMCCLKAQQQLLPALMASAA